MATAQDVTFKRYGTQWAVSNGGIETSGFESFTEALEHYVSKFPEVLADMPATGSHTRKRPPTANPRAYAPPRGCALY